VHFRQTIFAQSNVPRVNNVNFRVNVGTVVPSEVRIVPVHQVLVEIRPEFRDHFFFVVQDDIVIVDNSRRIVAVVPTGPSGAQLDSGSRSSGSRSSGGNVIALEDLNQAEIRQLQLVLINMGFDIGVADGRLGAKTRQALVTFQQRRGIQANGRIDQQTVVALGVNLRGMQGSNQPSTTGQGSPGQGNMQQQPPSGQSGNMQQQPPAGQGGNPPPAGQSGNMQQQPPAGQGGNPPATTGQGGNPPANQPPAGQGGNPPANQPPAGQGGNPPANQPPAGQGGNPPANPPANQPPANQPPASGGTAR